MARGSLYSYKVYTTSSSYSLRYVCLLWLKACVYLLYFALFVPTAIKGMSGRWYGFVCSSRTRSQRLIAQ